MTRERPEKPLIGSLGYQGIASGVRAHANRSQGHSRPAREGFEQAAPVTNRG